MTTNSTFLVVDVPKTQARGPKKGPLRLALEAAWHQGRALRTSSNGKSSAWWSSAIWQIAKDNQTKGHQLMTDDGDIILWLEPRDQKEDASHD